MYKDPDKQREANRKAKQRQRAAKAQSCTPQGMTKGVIVQGMTVKNEPSDVIPKGVSSEQHPAPDKVLPIGPYGATVLGIDPTETVDSELKPKSVTITKAESHVDASGIETVKALHQMIKPRRGKDIKCFADLPSDVQQTIDSLSMVDGKICQTVKANRTAIAINYQHLFPGRFHPTGIDVKLELTEPTMEPTPRISERVGS